MRHSPIHRLISRADSTQDDDESYQREEAHKPTSPPLVQQREWQREWLVYTQLCSGIQNGNLSVYCIKLWRVSNEGLQTPWVVDLTL